jgi:hypothetical protein
MKVGFTHMVMIQKQSNNRHSGRVHNQQDAKKMRHIQRSTKSMLIVFFNAKGIVHHEFVPPNTMVNSDIYCDVFKCLTENVQWKRLVLWRNHNWLLHHDNAATHTSLKTTEFVTNNNTWYTTCFCLHGHPQVSGTVKTATLHFRASSVAVLTVPDTWGWPCRPKHVVYQVSDREE